MMVRVAVAVAFLALAFCGRAADAAPSVTAGWDNLNPDRRMPKPDKVYWSAPYEKGANGFDVSWREGATGSVEFAADCIRIRKANDLGLVVITSVEPFEVPEKTELQAFVGVRTLNATDPDLARGYPRLWGRKENLAYFKDLDGPQNVSSPLQEGLFSLASGMFVRKLCHFRVDASGRATPAIVVTGAPSETEWFGWGVEDFAVAKKVWRKRACSDREPPDRSATQVDEHDFDARLASDVELAAAMRRIGDEVRLLVDGKRVPPAIYKPLPFGMGVPFTGEGKMFAESGIGLQTVNVRLGGGDKRLGFWSKDGFDVAGAVKRVKDAIRTIGSVRPRSRRTSHPSRRSTARISHVNRCPGGPRPRFSLTKRAVCCGIASAAVSSRRNT